MELEAQFNELDEKIDSKFGEIIPLKGDPGLSAYEIAIKNGTFNGTELEWLESLKGKTPENGVDYNTPEEKEELKNEVLTATKDQWIDLADITLEEAVSYIAFDKDVNGQPFSVKKLVAKIVAPEPLIYKAGVFVSTKVKLWGGVYAQHNIDRDMRTITIILEVTDKFTEIKINYNGSNQFSWANAWDQNPRLIMPNKTDLITAFYYGLQNTTNLCLPLGTTIKVWGVKA